MADMQAEEILHDKMIYSKQIKKCAAAAGFLMVNGAATATQGIGQIVNSVSGSKVLREDNTVEQVCRRQAKPSVGKPAR